MPAVRFRLVSAGGSGMRAAPQPCNRRHKTKTDVSLHDGHRVVREWHCQTRLALWRPAWGRSRCPASGPPLLPEVQVSMQRHECRYGTASPEADSPEKSTNALLAYSFREPSELRPGPT